LPRVRAARRCQDFIFGEAEESIRCANAGKLARASAPRRLAAWPPADFVVSDSASVMKVAAAVIAGELASNRI
jgi:hypothetical protein